MENSDRPSSCSNEESHFYLNVFFVCLSHLSEEIIEVLKEIISCKLVIYSIRVMCGIELIHRIQTTFFIVGSSGTFCFECILNKASYMAGRYPIWFSTVRHPRLKIGLQIFEKSRAETFCYLTFALKFPAFSYKMHQYFSPVFCKTVVFSFL